MKLLSFLRDGLEERSHQGFICVVDKKGSILNKIGDFEDKHFYLRSCAKPFQALPIMDYGLDFTSEELAVASSSHSGSDRHIKVLEGLLKKFDIDKSDLKCGVHPPLDKDTRHALVREGKEPNVLHNNCSGKHIGMLAVCKKKEWDLDSYLDFEHPLQKEIYEITENFCEDNIKYKTLDGCGTPIYSMPLKNIGLGFLNIFLNKKYEKLKHAFLENPYMVGGSDRQDTQMMNLSRNLIAKVGAEGLLSVVNLEKEQSIVVKIEDANLQARCLVMLESLRQLNWVTQDELDKSGIFDLNIKTVSGNIVGEIEFLYSLI